MTKADHLGISTTALALMVALLFGLLVITAKPAHAKTTFTVNYAGDATDDNPGDGLCDAGFGLCSLRAAIEEANAFAGADTIAFNIAGSGVKTIGVGSTGNGALPEITRQVTIDGYTQPGSLPNTNPQGAINASPLIELDGTNAGTGADGLHIGSNASKTVIRGLVINRFDDNGIASDDSQKASKSRATSSAPTLPTPTAWATSMVWIASGGDLANPPGSRRFDMGASTTLGAGRPNRKDGT